MNKQAVEYTKFRRQLEELQERENQLVRRGASPSCGIDKNWFSSFGRVGSSNDKVETRQPTINETRWWIAVTITGVLDKQVTICRSPGMSNRKGAKKPQPPLILVRGCANNDSWVDQIIGCYISHWEQIFEEARQEHEFKQKSKAGH